MLESELPDFSEPDHVIYYKLGTIDEPPGLSTGATRIESQDSNVDSHFEGKPDCACNSR
jgi:hypothetical protein